MGLHGPNDRQIILKWFGMDAMGFLNLPVFKSSTLSLSKRHHDLNCGINKIPIHTTAET